MWGETGKTMKIRILCVAGARPNFMKLAPLVAALERDPDFSPFIVHTGQHYDDQMSGQFFRDRAMPEEINRVVTDAIADLLLVTEDSGRRNLLAEGIPPERIHLVGNLMID